MLLSLALGGVAVVALPSGGVLLGATLTQAHWLRAAPAAILAALMGVAGLVPGALAGAMAGAAVAGAMPVGSEPVPGGIGALLTPLAVGAALGGAAAASAAGFLGAGVGFAGGVTADVLVNGAFEGAE